MITVVGFPIYEFTIAVSDVLLCIESLLFAYLLWNQKAVLGRLGRLGCILFMFLATSSLLGAIFHAFFPAKVATSGGWIIWMATAIAIGCIASVLWNISFHLFKRGLLERLGKYFVAIYLCVYLYSIFLVDYHYPTIILFYAPPVTVLGLIALRRFLLTHNGHWGNLLMGIALSMLGGMVQSFHISLDPTYLNYNTLYHIIQALALIYLFFFFRAPQRQE